MIYFIIIVKLLNVKIIVNGIILILSLKNIDILDLNKFKLDKNNYENWKVIYVFGNLFLDKDVHILW